MEVKKFKRVLTEQQGHDLLKKHIGEEYIQTLITSDTDGYDMYGNLLFKFRKNVIPMETLKQGVDNFKHSIEWTESRGAASGFSGKRIRKDGSVSNITVGKHVESGAVGYMDKSAMIKYCRQTAFTRSYFDKYQGGLPFVQFVDKQYKELCHTYYKRQKNIAEATNQNYVIGDTSFTTVTVNKNFRTAVHKDAGDFTEGFGNLIAYREGDWTGGYFILPEYGVGIDLHNTDILFVDVHKYHCNTNFINFTEDCLRISFVLYYREYMYKCKAPKDELKRVKIEQGGYSRL